MLFLIIILSYLIGSVPFALVIGKGIYKTDVRNYGSGNLGATNALSVLGVKVGLLVAVGDMAKGFLAASLPFIFGLNVHPVIIGLIAIIGHCFPIFAGFRGGKAIATSAGVFFYINPLMFLVGIITFFSFILITKYVVFGSITSGLSLLIYSIAIQDTTLIIITSILFIFLFYLHRSNFKNLLNGVEPKINDKNARNLKNKNKKRNLR